MKGVTIFLFALILPFCLCLAQDGEPKRTPPRDWTATTGQTVKAIATAYDGTTVKLLLATRREIELPASRLVEDDIKFLETFYPPPEPAHTIGQPSEPIEAGRDASYIAYIPSTYDPRGVHPLMVYTSSGGAKAQEVSRLQPGLQAHKWCLIGIVQSLQGMSPDEHYDITQRCIRHAVKEMPIDRRRIYFAGHHGSGAQALHNLGKYNGAGAYVASTFERYKERLRLGNKPVVMVSKADSAFRYTTAELARRNGGTRNTWLVYHDAGPPMGDEWLVEDAFLWLDARYLKRSYAEDAAQRRIAFEKHVLADMPRYQKFMGYRAYHWADYMLTEWPVSAENKKAFEDVKAAVGSTPAATNFTESLDAIAKFALTEYADLGKEKMEPRYNHTADNLAEDAREISEKFPESEMMETVIPMLGKKTQAPPDRK